MDTKSIVRRALVWLPILLAAWFWAAPNIASAQAIQPTGSADIQTQNPQSIAPQDLSASTTNLQGSAPAAPLDQTASQLSTRPLAVIVPAALPLAPIAQKSSSGAAASVLPASAPRRNSLLILISAAAFLAAAISVLLVSKPKPTT